MRTLIRRPALNQSTSLSRQTHARATYTVEQVAEMLGISRSHAYSCVKSGEIPSLRLRRRIVIPSAEVERLLRGERAATVA